MLYEIKYLDGEMQNNMETKIIIISLSISYTISFRRIFREKKIKTQTYSNTQSLDRNFCEAIGILSKNYCFPKTPIG